MFDFLKYGFEPTLTAESNLLSRWARPLVKGYGQVEP